MNLTEPLVKHFKYLGLKQITSRPIMGPLVSSQLYFAFKIDKEYLLSFTFTL